MIFVSRFFEDAANLLDAAECAAQSGQAPSHLTIVLGAAGGIRMIADSDWPLDSLQAFHGASTVYRVSGQNDNIRVEGRDGSRTCVFETPKRPSAAALILGGCATWMPALV